MKLKRRFSVYKSLQLRKRQYPFKKIVKTLTFINHCACFKNVAFLVFLMKRFRANSVKKSCQIDSKVPNFPSVSNLTCCRLKV